MTRLLLSFLSLAVAVSLAPAAAFGVEAPTDYGGDPPALTQEDKDAQAAEQIVDTGGSNSGTTANGETVLISKTIEATGIEDFFDITLTAEIGEAGVDNSTAVVVVMDISNTMNDIQASQDADGNDSSRSRLQNAQEAANEFIYEYCNGENLAEDRMFGLVTFNTNAQWANGLGLQAVSADSAPALQTSVNAITAPSTPADERFTNMEAGLRLAYNALDQVEAAHKYVIFLTDGFPTTYIDRSISGNIDSTESIIGYNPYEDEAYIATQVGEDGYFADAVLGLPCTYGTSYSDKAAALAEEIAAEMKSGSSSADSAGINIFSVGIDIGAQTIQAYIDKATASYSIVDRTNTDYVVGSATDPQAYRDWLANDIAGGPSASNGASTYADGDDRNELLAAFANILADIREATGFPLPSAIVSDPMGGFIEFEHFYNVAGEAANRLTGELGESLTDSPVENTASFDATANAIQWNLGQSGYELSEAEDGSRVYFFSLSYRVRLMTESEGFPFEEALPTNDDAVLIYEGADNTGELDEDDFLVYPNPSVRAFAEEPVDPDPENPDDPVDPADPADPVDPTDPENPGDPVDPADPDPSPAPADTQPDNEHAKSAIAQTGDRSFTLVSLALLVAAIAASFAFAVFAVNRRAN